MISIKPVKYLIISCFCLCFLTSPAQDPYNPNAAEIKLALEKLNVLGSALYIAAHPDDENTTYIAHLANGRHIRTGYISLTRGSGGQNLIGPEIEEQLGLIRTQELLQARRIDGGYQFFSTAKDFGYSKTAGETLEIWDKEAVLGDLVWVIRKFQPDILVTRFSPESDGETHGHHTASAQLAMEAFEAAGDPDRYPDQLKYVEPWQPTRLVWNTSPWFFEDRETYDSVAKAENHLQVDVGGYNALLGKSYTEISAKARSMHKSQGFGVSSSRGHKPEYFKPLKGNRAEKDLFEGVNLSWSRIEGGNKVGQLVEKAIARFEPEKPEKIVPTLLKAREALKDLPDSHWKKVKMKEVERVIQDCMGLFIEVDANDYAATPGTKVVMETEVINRSTIPASLKKIRFNFAGKDTTIDCILENNKARNFKNHAYLPDEIPYSQPYWLRSEGTKGKYDIRDQQMVGLPENPPALQATFSINIDGSPIQFTQPVVFQTTDPAQGEVYRPFEVTPRVFVDIAENVYVFNDNSSKSIHVNVQAGEPDIKGKVKLDMPAGWKVEPASYDYEIATKNATHNFSFEVTPPASQQNASIKAVAMQEGQKYNQGLATIDYDHIPVQTSFPEANADVVKIDIRKKGNRIGYVMGAGDNVPEALQQIGYRVDMLNPEQVTGGNLNQYDAIIMGIRAYNTQDYLKFARENLMDYVKNGGTMIVQYSKSYDMVTEEIGPDSIKLSHERVTVENAPVEILEPDHPIMNKPNNITSKDFEGWVQERGLYFATEWDGSYTPIFASNDPGEPLRKGGILYTQHGKGHFVYTGYSWFRQLPAGVPGAFRIFANLISLGN